MSNRKFYILFSFAILLSMPTMAQFQQKAQDYIHSAKDYIQSSFSKRLTAVQYEDSIRYLIRRGNWKGAKATLDEGLKKYKWNSTLNELMGQYWLHENNNNLARRYLIRAIQGNTDNAKAKKLLMNVEEKTGNYSSAIVYCNELLEVYPYEYMLWRKKISLYQKMGNMAEAERLLNRLNEIFPDNKDVKKDVMGNWEDKYRKSRQQRDFTGQEEALRQLIKISPKNEEYYTDLFDLLKKAGRSEEAAEIAVQAASVVRHPVQFVEKKGQILAGLQRYNEAIDYLNEEIDSLMNRGYNTSSLSELVAKYEVEAARSAARNDPYIAYGHVYEKQHTSEALDFLINMAISRGYLDDALYYINKKLDENGKKKEVKVIYQKYTVLKRMGKNSAANATLLELETLAPDNMDVIEDLAAMRLEAANECMDLGSYDEAVPFLKALAGMAKADTVSQAAAAKKLYICYVNLHKWGEAAKQLEVLHTQWNDSTYILKKAQLYYYQHNIQAALNLLDTDDMATKYHEEYEAMALEYVKQLISSGQLKKADEVVNKALGYCTDSSDLLQQGVTVNLSLYETKSDKTCLDKAVGYVLKGRSQFSDNPYFILKEAQFNINDSLYEQANSQLRQMLDTYIGDSTVIGAYTECVEAYMRYLLKEKNDTATAYSLVDDALNVLPANKSLLMLKEEILEKRHDWEAARDIYKDYHPSALEQREYNRHLAFLERKMLRNTVAIDYQMARPGSQSSITSTALVDYTHIQKADSYTLGFGYTGHDDTEASAKSNDTSTQVNNTNNAAKSNIAPGGTGVQIYGSWTHNWSSRWTTTFDVGWANKYFPTIKAGLAVTLNIPSSDWAFTLGGYYRQLKDTLDNDVSKSPKSSMADICLRATKTLGQFIIAGQFDTYLTLGEKTSVLTSTASFNGNLKAQFFPVSGVESHIFAFAGVGNAPDLSLVDKSMDYIFDELNVSLGVGGLYFFSKWLSASLSGSWFTMMSGTPRSYKNYFYLNANVALHF